MKRKGVDEMNEVKRWYRTLEISAHCLCEQGYNADNLIEIAKYLEENTGIKANPVTHEIQRTIDFHVWHNKQERKTKQKREREVRIVEKRKQKFDMLPVVMQQQMINDNKTYWNAVETYAKKGKRYAERIRKSKNINPKELKQ